MVSTARPIEEVTDKWSISSGAAASCPRSFGAPNRSRSEPQVTSAWGASELLYGGYAENPISLAESLTASERVILKHPV
jgi:hypothetical protein